MTKPNRTIKQIQEDVDAAKAELEKLEASLSAIPQRMQAAVERADSKLQVETQERGDELPIHIKAARLRHVRLRRELKEATELGFVAEVEKACENCTPIDEQFQQVEAERQAAHNARHMAQEQLRLCRSDIGTLKREEEALQRESLPHTAPVVRSVWQAGSRAAN